MRNSSIIPVALCILGLCVAAHAEGPFSVSATLGRSPEGKPLLSVSFSIEDKHYLYAESIKIETVEDIELVPASVQPPTEKLDVLSGKTVRVYTKNTVMTYSIAGDAQDPLAVTVRYQGCSDKMCFLPAFEMFSLSLRSGATTSAETSPTPPGGPAGDRRDLFRGFTVAGRASGYLKPGEFLHFLDEAESGSASEENALGRVLADRGAWILAVLILLGGLALNLTPCVLPMIPINIAIIGAGARAGTKARGLALGATYGAAIALVYGTLGILVVVTGSTFGTLNASPLFNLLVALVFVALALAMFDVFTIDLTRLRGSGRLGISERGGFLAALVMGGLSALLAGACVAPLLISVLLLAADMYAKGSVIGLALPLLLGAGMGLPWPFVGAGVSLLPKPGGWMIRVKQILAVIILGMGLYYGYLAYGLYSYSRESEATAAEGFVSAEEGLPRARAEHKPVFIDFWATWCKSCITMDKTTFRDPAVRNRLSGYVTVKYRAEDPKDPAVKEVLDRFGVVGLPSYVILTPPVRDPERIETKTGSD